MTGKAKRFCNLFLLLTRLLTNESFVFSPQSFVSDGFVQCVWEVTFESKSGNVNAIETGYMQHEMKAASFCIYPLSNQAIRLDSGADLRSILDNLRAVMIAKRISCRHCP